MWVRDSRGGFRVNSAIPFVADIVFIDPTNGSDGNGGKRQNDALASLTEAQDRITDNHNDMVVLTPGGVGTGTGTSEAAALTWSKNLCAIVGSCAPSPVSQRARILSTTAGVSTTTACFIITGHGNTFQNLQIGTFVDNNKLVQVNSDRNAFLNVHFAGIGDATAGDDAEGRSLILSGAEENLFSHCVFGLDTIMRSTTNSEVEFASSASRNLFENCRFIKAADNVGSTFVLSTGASGVDRWNEFNNTSWYSFWTNNADKITAVFNLSDQTTTGHILLTGNQVMVGCDDWEATASGRLYMEPASATANAIGIAINPTVS